MKRRNIFMHGALVFGKGSFLWVGLFLLFSNWLFVACKQKVKATNSGVDSVAVVPLKFNADSAFAFIVKQCSFGARVPNSAAHDKCAAYIVRKFKSYGLALTEQKTTVKGWDGKKLACNNITASYLPEEKNRIVICSHWESRPWADQDPDSALRHEPVMAANDGASGVAVMMELARQLKNLKLNFGIDFVCFDCEDYGAPYWGKGAQDESDWCLGSAYWAKHLAQGYHPKYGILLDMVGGKDAQFRFENFSQKFAPQVLAKVWSAAQTAGAGDYFKQEEGGMVTDDHLPMNQYGNIPTIDIICDDGNGGFCNTWHTTHDTPENISKATLRAVGQTLMQFLFEQKNSAQ